MKKTPSKRFDFFTAYHKEKLQKLTSYLFSGIFAIFLAFSFVSFYQGGDMSGLMASVGNLTKSTQYDADLILKRDGNTMKFTCGSSAEKVDSVEFTILSDPSRFRTITSTDPNVTISSLGDGMFRVEKKFTGQNIAAGSILTELQIDADAGAIVNLIDTKFTSGGVEYGITNKCE